MKFVEKYWIYLGLIGVIIFLIISAQISTNQINDLKARNNILSVLQDSLHIYKNKLNQLTYEKQAFNVKLKELQDSYGKLDGNNKELLNTINKLEKKSKIITATIVRQEAVIDSLLNITPIVDKEKGTLLFSDSTKYLQYNFLINTKQESLLIQKLRIPNNLYISHKFTKEGINVSVTNSNDKYYKVNDINSYVIPLDKKKNNFKKYFTIGAISFVGGAGIASFILLK